MDLSSKLDRFGIGGLTRERMPTTCDGTDVRLPCSSLQTPFSTATIISLNGTRRGAGAKFRTFSTTLISWESRRLLERITTHLPGELWSVDMQTGLARIHNLSNFLFCLDLHLSISLDSMRCHSFSKAEKSSGVIRCRRSKRRDESSRRSCWIN